MRCDQSQEAMMDVLYGEDVTPRHCFEFFQHLDDCPVCSREYVELLETREMLAEWQVEDPEPDELQVELSSSFIASLGRVRWWTALQKVAAAVLIVVGLVTIVQYMGYLGGQRLVVEEQQLTQLVHDMMVSQQVEERRLMLQAMLRVKEDVELQQRENFQQLERDVVSLEQRYLDNLEENNHYLRTLLSR